MRGRAPPGVRARASEGEGAVWGWGAIRCVGRFTSLRRAASQSLFQCDAAAASAGRASRAPAAASIRLCRAACRYCSCHAVKPRERPALRIRRDACHGTAGRWGAAGRGRARQGARASAIMLASRAPPAPVLRPCLRPCLSLRLSLCLRPCGTPLRGGLRAAPSRTHLPVQMVDPLALLLLEPLLVRALHLLRRPRELDQLALRLAPPLLGRLQLVAQLCLHFCDPRRHLLLSRGAIARPLPPSHLRSNGSPPRRLPVASPMAD